MSRRKRTVGVKSCDHVMTLDEIDRELGVTRERVRQLEARALRKAKAILEMRGFTLRDLVPDEARNDEFLQDLLPTDESRS